MRRIILSALTCAAALATAVPAATSGADGILATQKPGYDALGKRVAELDALNRRLGCISMSRALRGPFGDRQLAESLGLTRMVHLRFEAGADLEHICARYRELGCFETVELNHRFNLCAPAAPYPDDPYFNWLWALDNRQKFDFGVRWIPEFDADIDALEAWGITTGDSAVVVGVIDTGLRTGHPELAGRIWVNPGESAGNGLDDDGNGYVDDVNGWDFWYDDNVPEDSVGHGTAVTGVIAANGYNGIGHIGVDLQCKVMPLKVIGNSSDGTTLVLLIDALRYAADEGADVVNMSLGDTRGTQQLSNAVTYAYSRGVVLVAASGNDNAEQILYPAFYTSVIAVGATDPDDGRSDHFGADTSSAGSNYGAQLDVVAPGNNIFLLNAFDDTLYTGGSGGTSLASPYVAGIASLLLALDSTLTPDEVRERIQSSADDTVGDPAEDTPGWDKYMGWGRVSAYQALTYGATASRPLPAGHRTRAVVEARGGRILVRGGAGTMVEMLAPDGTLVRRVHASRPGEQLLTMPAPGAYVYRTGGGGQAAVGRVVIGR